MSQQQQHNWRQFWTHKSGSVVVSMALGLPILLGFTALGVETAVWYSQRNTLQSAADAAAIAGAHQLRRSASETQIKETAIEEAVRNNYVLDVATNSINYPPLSGAYTGDEAVEANLSAAITTLITSYFLTNAGSINVRAVARVAPGTEACVLALDPTADSAIDFSGSSVVSMTNCTIASNSISTTAISVSGSADVTTECVSAVGGVDATSGLNLTGCSKPVTKGPVVSDPYAGLAIPTDPVACSENNYKIVGAPSQVVTMAPGRYCGGADLQTGQVTMQPGVYIMDGGDFEIGANATVTGTGVTIYLANNAGSNDPVVTINGGGAIDITAPNTGTYAGVLFFQDPDSEGSPNTFNGNSVSNFTGAIYMPNTHVRFLGNNATGGGCTQIVANTVEIQGSADLDNECDGVGTASLSVPGHVQLVE
ncbi:MAG: hypothetical protein HON14_06995 [Rhodospirillaceae bacterium]|jgi:Flp pilus assembly protein TadG|nr:hypothetical protein [Rhodospirillaceae bacterium]MBT4589799.1 hypothetical protein [Rhodospirillaceae bacterium]MBT4938862.1 hypothetical protein [Rhodospirillaceae bacterium]MBT5938414.1 hypothetical protein [Rhodospirillaceae bacterium]MBT7268192.1 hypothetical protein [Rhodospirillaceae bacterium]